MSRQYLDEGAIGETEAELQENLIDLYHDFTHKLIPHVRRKAELKIA